MREWSPRKVQELLQSHLVSEVYRFKPKARHWSSPLPAPNTYTLSGSEQYKVCLYIWVFPGGSDSKESACNAGDLGLIPGSGRSSGERNVNPLQYSCLENPMDGRAWCATVHGVTKSRTPLSDLTTNTYIYICIYLHRNNEMYFAFID